MDITHIPNNNCIQFLNIPVDITYMYTPEITGIPYSADPCNWRCYVPVCWFDTYNTPKLRGGIFILRSALIQEYEMI